MDGTTPSEESNVYVDGILLSVDKENAVEQYTIKVIAVKDGISSEVSTFAYIVSDVPVITCDQELFKIYNLEEEAIFIVAGYSGEKLNDVKIIPLSQSSQITLASTGLDTSKSNTIKAFLWKDLQTLLPLYRNIGTLLLVGIKTVLWTCLFIIPGVIKSFEYAIIPYILADDAEISSKDAFKKAKQMMKGNKWRLFKLDFSFIGWALLCFLTLGIGTFFLIPYVNAAAAEFYVELKNKQA